MALSPGTRLGAYEITALLGAGGMGEVYRARDTKLQRDVALKVLPDAFAADADRLARFRREAQVLAALNHTHIAQIYGLEETPASNEAPAGPQLAVVMELVDGEGLDARLARGPVPGAEALELARQLAEALDAAHTAGIIHRDLKPANIKVREDGTVKILDFGLAKVLAPDTPAGTIAPTITSPAMTQAGVILGTAAYMSPEQARGKAVDKRADIWAFGCVLYEMLTARRPFDGETLTDVLGAIVKTEPDYAALPADTPHNVRQLLEHCLQKDLSKRLRDIGDASAHLTAIASNDNAPAKVTANQSAARSRGVIAAASLIAGIAAGASSATWYLVRDAATPAPQVRFEIPMVNMQYMNQSAVSPDGRHVAWIQDAGGTSALWMRAIDSLESRMLRGTENARDPFWSADSRYIAFSSGDRLLRVDVAGGPPTSIGLAGGFGGAWNTDGVLLVGRASTGGIVQLRGDHGSEREQVNLARWPSFLPDGRHFLYVSMAQEPHQRGIWVANIDSGTPKPLLPDSSRAVYSAGHLLFVRDGTLLARPFDTARLEFTGEAVTLAENVSANPNGQAAVSASVNGTLAYRQRQATDTLVTLTWVNRDGRRLGTLGVPGRYAGLDLSPDGTRVALHRHETSGGDVWIADVDSGHFTRVTFDATTEQVSPIWSPDGRHVVYAAQRSGKWGLYQRAAGGEGTERLVQAFDDAPRSPMSWSSSGQWLLFMHNDTSSRNWDLWALQPGSTPVPLFRTPTREGFAQISPSGRFMAYASSSSGNSDVYVESFPPGTFKRQVSIGGGSFPRWRRDGKELYFTSDARDGTISMMASTVRETGAGLEFTPAETLFKDVAIQNGPVAGHTGNHHVYAVDPHGQRFLLSSVGTPEAPPGPTPLTVVVNWQSAISARERP